LNEPAAISLGGVEGRRMADNDRSSKLGLWHSVDSAEAERDDNALFLLLETLPHIAFLIRTDGTAEYYNRQFIAYVGHSLGRDPADRHALHHPDDIDALNRVRGAGVQAGVEYLVEVRLRRHDGVFRWHRIHNKPIRRGGEIVGWLGTAVDFDDMRRANELLEQRVVARTVELEAANSELKRQIAERQRTEERLLASRQRFRDLYDRTPLALQSVDGQARLVDVNDYWLQLFGYERDDVIGKSPPDFMTPDSALVYRSQAWPAMLSSHSEVRTVEYKFIKRSGEVFDGRLSARGEFDAAGRMLRSWSAISDVTGERRAQAALQQAMRMDAIGQLTSGVAHDFNNLLTAIMGSLELLGQTAKDPRSERLIGTAQSAAARGSGLTRQLLAFARKQHLVAETIDLNVLVTRTLDLARSAVEARYQITTDLAGDLWSGLGDSTQLGLVLLNLAINARDAMPDGGTITIGTRNDVAGIRVRPEEPEPGEYVVLSVSDRGIGMDAPTIDRAFEPFFTTKETGKGSGLGLSQVLGVAQQLGGGARIVSAVGEGTTVDVFLPRRP
jgi:PAS domain S-box-containing protein